MPNRNVSFSSLMSKLSVVTSAFFITTSAFAIGGNAIEPSHSYSDYGANDVAISAPAATMQPIATASIGDERTSPTRIYYARSMTANNPEYKTRFSILHETPSPKRIGGERLYNLSDEIFRLEVDGNNIRLIDNPIFQLTGINSAEGRYGELQLHEGGSLKIHGTSDRFRGKWDIDGTGARLEKVTPTNLVSGDLPATLRTFNADGTPRTSEDYTLTFKAMAMGPYNGYWTDGTDIGIWLWGMSKKKTQSGEFTYVGLDLGIITLPTEATAGIDEEEEEEIPEALRPIPPIGDGLDSTITNSIGAGAAPTAIGGTNISNFSPGGSGIVPFPIGGGGGGGGTIIVTPFCDEYPNDPSCRPLCERFPNDPSCKPLCEREPNNPSCRPLCEREPNNPTCKPHCERFPNDPTCKPHCESFPNDPTCKPRCESFPNDPECRPLCERKPNHPSCKPLCERKPNHPECKPLCERKPNHPECKPLCERKPNHPSCKPLCERKPNHLKCDPDELCKRKPNHPDCRPLCERNPKHPSCVELCVREPEHPDCKVTCMAIECDPDYCTENPDSHACKPSICETDPTHPECVELCERLPDHPDCNRCPDGSVRDMLTGQCGGDNCETNPTAPECTPTCKDNPNDPSCDPGTPVSAPWGLGAIMIAFAGFIFRRRK